MYSSIIHYRGWLCPLQFHWNPNFLSILYLYFSFWAPSLSLIFLSRDSQLALKRLLMHLFADIMIDSDYQDNDKVRTARDRYIELGAEAGFEVAPITWSRRQKGIDDLYKHLFRSK